MTAAPGVDCLTDVRVVSGAPSEVELAAVLTVLRGVAVSTDVGRGDAAFARWRATRRRALRLAAV